MAAATPAAVVAPAAVAVSAAAAAPAAASAASAASEHDAVVVGAGFAGLTAARTFSAFGLRPIVVEARRRLGGRAYTDEFPSAPELELDEAAPVEEGCNYLHGCEASTHPLFLLARYLNLPTALASGDLGGQWGGWESVEVAEWRDAEKGGEVIPLEEVVEALFLLEQVVCGISYVMLRDSDPDAPERRDLHSAGSAEGTKEDANVEEEAANPRVIRTDGTADGLRKVDTMDGGETADVLLPMGRPETLEEAFQWSLAAVLERRRRAGRRQDATLSARERAMVYSMRGRHFGFVSACRRMPPKAVVQGTTLARSKRVFEDGRWPHSEDVFVRVCRLLRRKLELVSDFGRNEYPEAYVALEAENAGEDRLLLGPGFKVFIEFLAEGQEVILGDPVFEVEQSSDCVVVRLRSGQVLTAPCAVITAPAGVLAGLCPESHITFNPPLPEEKLAAIRRLALPERGATTHEKVVLRWAPTALFVATVLDAPGAPLQIATTDRRFHFLNLHKYGRRGQLLCHIWGDAEWKEHAQLSDLEIVSEVVSALRAIFPGEGASPLVARPPQWKVTRWSQDPFALGAYTELQDPRACEQDHTVYARTEGCLYFAGEGAVPSSVGAQCTHGALLSGASAALAALVDGRSPAGGAGGGASDRGLDRLFDEEGPLGLHVGALVDLLVRRGVRPKRPRCGGGGSDSAASDSGSSDAATGDGEGLEKARGQDPGGE